MQIAEERFDRLEAYSEIPIAFEVHSRFRVDPVDAGLGGFRFVEEPVRPAWTKDYDTDGGDDRPMHWRRRDLSNWSMFVARDGEEWVGGAVLASDTPGLDMLEGRADLGVLWDIRVAPGHRGRGVGRALFEAVESKARAHGCVRLKVETQNINVPACRFYAAMGCVLDAVIVHAYADYPDEVRLHWEKSLA